MTERRGAGQPMRARWPKRRSNSVGKYEAASTRTRKLWASNWAGVGSVQAALDEFAGRTSRLRSNWAAAALFVSRRVTALRACARLHPPFSPR
jgi:hypothetical protein